MLANRASDDTMNPMFELYKQLRDAGFPQGGSGSYILDPNTDEKVYKPLPSEIYTLFVADPSGWDKMLEAMSKVWLEVMKK